MHSVVHLEAGRMFAEEVSAQMCSWLAARYLWGQASAQVNLGLQIFLSIGSLVLRHADFW